MRTRSDFIAALIILFIIGAVEIAQARMNMPRGPVREGQLDDADLDATRDLSVIGCGSVSTTISNYGELGNPDQIPGYRGFVYPRGSGNDFLWSAGIWVGAEVEGVARVTTATDGDNGTGEFWPVHIGTVPFENLFGENPAYDWHFSSRSVAMYEGRSYIYGAQGIDDDGDFQPAQDDRNGNGQPDANWDGGSGWIGSDDDSDGAIDEELADGIDNDSDSRIDEDTNPASDANHDGNCRYDPEGHIDEDPAGDMSHDYRDNDRDGLVDADDPDFDGDLNPGFYDDDNDGMMDEDAAAFADQELFAVYQDSISEQFVSRPSGPHLPLNIEIADLTQSWPSSSGAYVLLKTYTIRNRGNQPLEHVYLSMFADPDIIAEGEGGDAGSTDDGNFYDPARLMMIQYDDTNDADGDGPGVFAIRVVRTPVALNQLRVTFANFERVAGGDPNFDQQKYDLISSGDIAPATDQFGDWRMLFAFGEAANDGFEILPGGILEFSVALIGAGSIAEAQAISDAFESDYLAGDLPQAPFPPVGVHRVANTNASVELDWDAPNDNSVTGYHLYGTNQTQGGNRIQYGGLIGTTGYTVTGLTNGHDILFEVVSVSASGMESLPTSLIVRVGAADPIQGLTAQNLGHSIALNWQPSEEPNIIEYSLLKARRWPHSPDSITVTLGPTQTTYTDAEVVAGYEYEYRVAVRSSFNILSRWSDSAIATPWAPERRVLLFDEHAHTTTGIVPDDSITALYQSLMTDLGIAFDYCAMPECLGEILGNYDRVIWFSENRAGQAQTEREDILNHYVTHGGKLLRIARRFMAGHLGYSRGVRRASLSALQPLTFDSVYVSNWSPSRPGMQFVGAQAALPGFPDIEVSQARLDCLFFVSTTYDYLPDIDIFWPNDGTGVLYRAQVLATDSSGYGNQPCAVYGGGEIVLAFPLYFLPYEQARTLLTVSLAALDTITAVNPELRSSAATPASLILYPSYPNPFNPLTTLRFELARAAFVRLEIYDILGRKLNDLLAENMQPGLHNAVWNGATNAGTEAATGLYFARLVVGSEIRTQKLLLLK